MTDNLDTSPEAMSPEDLAIAQEIQAIDPVLGTKGPTSYTNGDPRLMTAPTVDALPPEKAKEIRAKLAGVPSDTREARERELVHEALYENSMALRIMAGAGDDATAYHREMFQQANERREATQELYRLSAELAEVIRWDVVTNEITGEQTNRPVERFTGDTRRAKEARRVEVERRLNALEGEPGKRRLEAALRQSVAERKSLLDRLDEEREVNERAESKAREARIEAKAEARARFKTPSAF